MITELKPTLVEEWAKKFYSMPHINMTTEQAKKFLTASWASMTTDTDTDPELISLLDKKQGGMASVIWLRVKHCHSYEITPSLAVWLGEIIDNFGKSTMICNIIQYKAHEHNLPKIGIKEFGLHVAPMGLLAEKDWEELWQAQKLSPELTEQYRTDNLLDIRGVSNSILTIGNEQKS